MSNHSKYEAETTHRLAGIFYHFYSNEFTKTKCPNCESRLTIEKKSAFKDIGLRFWKVLLRTTNGEVYLPLKEFLLGGLFKVRGFSIVHTSAGEDLLMCWECQNLFSVFDVNYELNIVLYEGFNDEVEKRRKEEENRYKAEVKENRPTENFVLPDGSQISTGCNCVIVRWSSPEATGSIYDILKINYSGNYIGIESVLSRNNSDFRMLLSRFENIDGTLLALASTEHKSKCEDRLFDRYPPHDFEFTHTSFRKASLALLCRRLKRKFKLYKRRISPV